MLHSKTFFVFTMIILYFNILGSTAVSPQPNKQPYKIAGGSAPGTPGSNRIHSIASLTPYQNR